MNQRSRRGVNLLRIGRRADSIAVRVDSVKLKRSSCGVRVSAAKSLFRRPRIVDQAAFSVRVRLRLKDRSVVGSLPG